MSGARATPALDVSELVRRALGPENAPELELRDVMNCPGSHVGGAEALAIAREACATAETGRGVVVTCGTDTMEELAMLSDLVHDGQEPIVFTGANRPASHPGADGPANLADAVAVAGARSCAGLGDRDRVRGRDPRRAAWRRRWTPPVPRPSARRRPARSDG